MPYPEKSENRKKDFKKLSSEERQTLIRKKLKKQGLKEGSGVLEKDQSSYDKNEVINLILITRCFGKKMSFNYSYKKIILSNVNWHHS